MKAACYLALLLSALAYATSPAATFTVTNILVSGPDSLSNAIAQANATAGTDTIAFNIPGPGVRTISITKALPSITQPMIIDGYTQPLAGGNNAVLLIELSGGGRNINGLRFTGGGTNCTVRGLVLNGFDGTAAIFFDYGTVVTSSNVVEGCFIGTDAAGAIVVGPNADGVRSIRGVGNRIGGATPASRNLISGNRTGILLAINSSNNVVQGNFIGTDVTGTNALANRFGINVESGSDNTLIGGTNEAARNIIAGNGDGDGIQSTSASRHVIQGNFIGTDVTGTKALRFNTSVFLTAGSSSCLVVGLTATPGTPPGNLISGADANNLLISNQSHSNVVQGNLVGTDATGTFSLGNIGNGIVLASTATHCAIGGTNAGAANVISGHDSYGIALGITSGGARTNLIQGNRIGTDITGANPLPNATAGGTFSFYGIRVDGPDNTIGPGNIIAFNGGGATGSGDGIHVLGTAVRTRITGNSIFANGDFNRPELDLGIDLGPINDGVTANDSGDIDGFQNFPVITGVSVGGGNVTLSGHLFSGTNTSYRLEFFSNASCDTSGNGEGQVFLGFTNVTTDASGNAAFAVTLPNPAGHSSFTATAIATNGSTSEFSACASASGPCAIVCPTNMVVSTTPGLCGANVSFFPVTSGNCGAVTSSPPSGSFFAKGTNTVTCTAGGTNCQFTITVLDTQPPIITCPANIVTNVPPGQTHAVVNYPRPAVTENCPGVTTNCTPPSGSVFPQGVTTVTCTAIDTSGNSNSCSFTVTVTTTNTPLAISPISPVLLSGQTQTFTATNGIPPYTFSLLSNNSGGNIDAASGLYTAGPTNGVTDTVIVTDASNATALATVQVIAPLQILPTHVVLASAQTRIFTATGGTAPYAFSIVQNNSGGAMNGASGLYTAGPTNGVTDTVQVTDSGGRTAQATINVTPSTLIVTTTNDSGPGSLRQAINDAITSPEPLRRIHFVLTNPPPHIITLQTRLVVRDRTLIDATTQPGFSGTPIVTIRALPRVSGMHFFGTNSLVRGLVFNDFNESAIELGGLSLPNGDGNVVENCYFGLDTSGTNAASVVYSGLSAAHIICYSDNNRIGGTNPAARSVFAGRTRSGVLLIGGSNVVQGNFFGTDITGTNRLGELGIGVTHNGSSARVGGVEPGAGNLFAFLTHNGVLVRTNRQRGTIRGNSMFANGRLGIGVGGGDLPLPNDSGDGDNVEGNDGQNYPIIARVHNQGGVSVISGTLNSKPGVVFALDFYANNECDPSGHGEGRRYLGFTNITTDASGNASFDFTPTIGGALLDPSEVVTATATDAEGNTSEFSECSGATSSISGQVAHSGTPLSGVTINLFGTRAGTTTTDASGNFVFNGFPTFGAYSVTPSKAGFAFTPQSQSFSNLIVPGVANFDFNTANFRITGLVRDTAGNAVVRAEVALSGGAARTTVSDNFGAFVFTSLPGFANYTLSASKTGFTFGAPTNINNLIANQIVNFIGAPSALNIAGHVRNTANQPIAGVTVRVFPSTIFTVGPVLQTVQSDAQGAYQFSNLRSNQRYLVSPSASQQLFTPDSATLFLDNANLTADFTIVPGHQISGRITEDLPGIDTGLAGVAIQFVTQSTGRVRGSTLTDAVGDFVSPLLPDGADYEIRPVNPAFTFTPPSRVVLNLNADVSGQDSSGLRQNFEIGGRVLNDGGFTMSDALVSVTGGSNFSQAVSGTFSFPGLPGGNSYTLTPSRPGFTFMPSNIVINPLTNSPRVEFRGTPFLSLTGRIGFLTVNRTIVNIMNADSSAATAIPVVSEPDTFGNCPQGTFPHPLGIGCMDLPDPSGPIPATAQMLGISLAPDSRTVLFNRVESPLEALSGGILFKRDTLAGSAAQTLASRVNGRPSWSANGLRVAYANSSNPGLWVRSPDGSMGTFVPGTGLSDSDPALSPDGTQIAFARPSGAGGQHDIFIISVNGTGLMQATTSPGDDIEPSWSSDGQSIAFASNRGGDYEIFRMDTQQFQEFVLTANDTDDREPTWSPDGSFIAFRRTNTIYAIDATDASLQIPLRTGAAPSWGALPELTTPAGTDVVVTAGAWDVTFDSIAVAGATTILPIATDDPAVLPEGYFSLDLVDFAFDVSTTASFTPPVTVCLTLAGLSQDTFNQVQILHEENGQLVPRTTSRNYPTLCAEVTDLSPFRLLQQIDPARPMITGLVVDSNGFSLSRIPLSLSGAAEARTTTDTKGRFTIANLTNADYSIRPIDSRYDFVPRISLLYNLTGTNTLVFTAIPIASPTLSISPDANAPGMFNLTWPIESWGFVLEFTDSPESPNWIPVLTPPAAIGNNFVVTIQASNASRFFRLRQQ